VEWRAAFWESSLCNEIVGNGVSFVLAWDDMDAERI
jgi:hypothetical protein